MMISALTKKRTGLCAKAAFAAAFLALAFPPSPARAQICEMPFIPPVTAAVLAISQQVTIDLLFAPPGEIPNLPGILRAETTFAQHMVGGETAITGISIPSLEDVPGIGDVPGLSEIPILGQSLAIANGEDWNIGGLAYMDTTMRRRLDTFWVDLLGSLRAMMAQIYASDLNTARMLASINDSSDMAASMLRNQEQEIDAKLKNVISSESCQFDTLAQTMAPAVLVSKAMTNAYAQQYNDRSDNAAGSIAAGGAGLYNNARFRDYETAFCDPAAEGGRMPCSAAPGMANAAITPGKTLFGRETLDMSNPDVRTAVDHLTGNITGYVPVAPVPQRALDSAQGQEVRRQGREYAARMDAVSSLVTGIVGDRAPAASSETGQRVQQLRQQAGAVETTTTPSMREVRQAVVEQVQTPVYYANLNDAGGTVAQKELYLKAYNAMLIYQMVEKQERISTVYAIETAEMLQEDRNKIGTLGGQAPGM